ncbi:MAG: glycosyltransferase family 39 protein [bacterium]|nr:glycosyltransferase family 39 protein [bacterium]
MHNKASLITPLILFFYLTTHLFGLLQLPVFADEAIYIRWAQLILDDWQQYLFFALNDGKSPLFIWFLAPFQYLFTDQLFAARFVAVLVGLFQLLAIGRLTKVLGGGKKAQWLSMILASILPFWYFHHRVALIDGLLTFALTLTSIGLVSLANILSSQPRIELWKREILTMIIFTGLAFGMALWTKLPAILWLPTFIILPLLATQQRRKTALASAAAAGIGFVTFAALRISPAFGQLFSRGSDFLYPWQEVVLSGGWQSTLPNLPTYVMYFVNYLSWPILVLVLLGLFSRHRKRTYHFLWLSALGFFLPIAILGRVVYPRYFLPAILPLTISAALVLEEYVHAFVTKQKKMLKKMVASLLIVSLVLQIVSSSSAFIFFSITNSALVPFVSADRTQYLTEWSSGHGITETVSLINEVSQTKTVAVATEGYFGTLPDGLLLYFHNRPVDNIYVEGIGQPVASIPESFMIRARTADQTLLVVNSHRLLLELPKESLVAEYCRPFAAPCLQVWDITGLIRAE